jgi:hypothetical protein
MNVYVCAACQRAGCQLESALERQQRVQDRLEAAQVAHKELAVEMAKWRGNYRAVLQVLHDENNTLRELASYKSAQVLDLAAALQTAPRKRWWQPWR